MKGWCRHRTRAEFDVCLRDRIWQTITQRGAGIFLLIQMRNGGSMRHAVAAAVAPHTCVCARDCSSGCTWCLSTSLPHDIQPCQTPHPSQTPPLSSALPRCCASRRHTSAEPPTQLGAAAWRAGGRLCSLRICSLECSLRVRATNGHDISALSTCAAITWAVEEGGCRRARRRVREQPHRAARRWPP